MKVVKNRLPLEGNLVSARDSANANAANVLMGHRVLGQSTQEEMEEGV